MKRYNDALVKDTKEFREETLNEQKKKEEARNGLSNGIGEEAEDFTETEDTSLSNGDGEDGGDFMGSGEMNESGGQRKMKVSNEPAASAGKIETDPDFEKIETGMTGTNVKKDYKQEKAGSGESEKERETNMRNPE